jgi:hypothetical protein
MGALFCQSYFDRADRTEEAHPRAPDSLVARARLEMG